MHAAPSAFLRCEREPVAQQCLGCRPDVTYNVDIDRLGPILANFGKAWYNYVVAACLQAGEHVDRLARVFDPHVQGLALLHHNAWRHDGALSVPQATVRALGDAQHLRQEAPQGLFGVCVQAALLLECPYTDVLL